MALDPKAVQKTATLSRLNVTPDEEKDYIKELSAIISWFEEIQEVNTDDVEPLLSPGDTVMSVREDKVTDGYVTDTVLSHAPDTAYNYYAVTRVVE